MTPRRKETQAAAHHDAEIANRAAPTEREAGHDGPRAAEAFAARLDRPMGALGIVFLLVVLGQLLATEQPLTTILSVVGWMFWAVFVAEFLLRAYIGGFGREFWRRNWWQVLFLLLPFLRFFRALQAFRLFRVARVARLGGILSAGVRGTRSAGRLLSGRVAWLAAVTVIVILASSQLLYATGSHERYSEALYEAALATITGSGLSSESAFPRILHVLLAVYSVAIFATLAGSIGAYFLRKEAAHTSPHDAPPGSALGVDGDPRRSSAA